MLTKAIIIDKLLDNHYLIRIPLLESPGDLEDSKIEAILSHTPGIEESYKSGDVVIVGFEEHSADNPIILGKLFTRDDVESRGHAQLESLSVKDNVSLPKDITSGGVTFTNFSQLIEHIQDMQKTIEEALPKKQLVGTFNTSSFAKQGSDNFYSISNVSLTNFIEGADLIIITWGNCFAICPLPLSGPGRVVAALWANSGESKTVRVKYEVKSNNTKLDISLDSSFIPPSNFIAKVLCFKI